MPAHHRIQRKELQLHRPETPPGRDLHLTHITKKPTLFLWRQAIGETAQLKPFFLFIIFLPQIKVRSKIFRLQNKRFTWQPFLSISERTAGGWVKDKSSILSPQGFLLRTNQNNASVQFGETVLTPTLKPYKARCRQLDPNHHHSAIQNLFSNCLCTPPSDSCPPPQRWNGKPMLGSSSRTKPQPHRDTSPVPSWPRTR